MSDFPISQDRMPTVEVGQVWKSNDRRDNYSHRYIEAVKGVYAYVRYSMHGGGRRGRIRLDRFVQTQERGYTLVKKAPPVA